MTYSAQHKMTIKSKDKLNWNIHWRINRSNKCKLTITQQIVVKIRSEVKRGNFPDDLQLPSILKMAKYLGVDRGVVSRSYLSLVTMGLLYSTPSVGYFVNEVMAKVEEPDPVECEEELLPINERFEHRDDQKLTLNTLVLGRKVRRLRHDAYAAVVNEQLPKSKVDREISFSDFIFQHASGYLKGHKYIQRSSQLCILPESVTLMKVLKYVTKPGDQVGIVSSSDTKLTNLLNEHLRIPIFTGGSKEGMRVDNLMKCCEQSEIKAVIVKHHDDGPFPSQLTESCYREILALSSVYKFWVIFLDDDPLYHHGHHLNPAIDTDRVVYVCLRQFIHEYYNFGLVCGPSKLVRILREEAEPMMDDWDDYSERRSFFKHAMEQLEKEIRHIQQTRNGNQKHLKVAFEKYLGSMAELTVPELGQFATITFNTPIDPGILTSVCQSPVFNKRTNLNLKFNEPIQVISISLMIKDWGAVKAIFKEIRRGC